MHFYILFQIDIHVCIPYLQIAQWAWFVAFFYFTYWILQFFPCQYLQSCLTPLFKGCRIFNYNGYSSPKFSIVSVSVVSVSCGQMKSKWSSFWCSQRDSRSLTLCHVCIIHLTSSHPVGIFLPHIIKEGWVQYNKIFWERPYSRKFHYSVLLELFCFIVVVNFLLCLLYK